MIPLPRFLVPLFLAGAATVLAGDLPVDVKVTGRWVDNLSRTSAANKKDAATWSAEVSTAWGRPIARNWLVSATAGLDRTTVPDFRALDSWRGTAGAGLRRKFGLGPLAPVVEFNLATARQGFRESGRSGWELSGGVSAAKRFTDAWRAALSAEWLQYWATGAPFDIRHHRLTLDTTWDVTDRWQVGAGAGRLSGQLTANAAGPIYASALAGGFGPAIQGYYRAIPWRTTHTYGPNWVAYRVDVDADFWWLSLSPALTDRTSLPIRLEEYEVVNRVGVRYKTRLFSASLVHRF